MGSSSSSGAYYLNSGGGTVDFANATISAGIFSQQTGDVHIDSLLVGSTAFRSASYTFRGGTLDVETVSIDASPTRADAYFRQSGGTLTATQSIALVGSRAEFEFSDGSIVTPVIQNEGTLRLVENLPNTTRTIDADFVNSGEIRVESDSAILGDNLIFTNTGTVRLQNAAMLDFDGAFDNQGEVIGIGTFGGSDASFVNSGTIAPGASPGVLTLSGDFTQTASGMLDMEIGGPTAGEDYDRLHLDNGIHILGGTLIVGFIDDFSPSAGALFQLIVSDNLSGDFDVVTVTGLAPELTYQTRLENNVYELEVRTIPEPTTMLLTLIGLFPLLCRRRRIV